jgi:hypothetical protein
MDPESHAENVAGKQDGDVRAAAARYVQRGWSVIPVPYRSKNPGLVGWQRLRLAAAA